jgi:O-antigen/teichoic acid export membrane protein
LFNPRQFIKETFVYGLATVVPRVLNFLLVPLHTQTLPVEGYAENTAFYVYAAFFNILLTYGMETSFFRFFSQSQNSDRVVSTATITLAVTTLLIFGGLFLQADNIARLLGMSPHHFYFLLGVLLCDTLVVLPFAYLRATRKASKFTFLKLVNVGVYVTLNVLFLWWLTHQGTSLPWGTDIVQYVFIANL